MTQQEREILQLARRIQALSYEPRNSDLVTFRLNKIQELVNAMIPRIEGHGCEEDIPA